jgi:hypothetical protein
LHPPNAGKQLRAVLRSDESSVRSARLADLPFAAHDCSS